MSAGTNHNEQELRQQLIAAHRDMRALITAQLQGEPVRKLFMDMLAEKPAQHRAPYAAQLIHMLTAEHTGLLVQHTGGPHSARAYMQQAGMNFENSVERIRAVEVDENGNPHHE